jgi:hypothetical protein
VIEVVWDRMTELVFEVTQEADGGFCAECLTESIFTQGNTWDELRANVREVVGAFYFDGVGPEKVRMRLYRDEVVSVA